MTEPQKDNARRQPGGVDQTNHIDDASYDATPAPVKYPDPRHLPGRVLARLLLGRRYTHLDSWRELGHARLADSVWKLRKSGWPVEMIEREVATSDHGRAATIGIYYLRPETIAEAGDIGRQYVINTLTAEQNWRAA